MQIKHLSFSYGDFRVLKDINIEFKSGKVTTLMGANGCGKSTVLNIIARNLKYKRGRVFLNGKNINDYKSKEYAKEVARVYQQNRILSDITVEKLVSYGRTPHLKPLKKYSEEDTNKVDWALEVTGLTDIRLKEVRNLSGGQRQRVFIAMALAQDSKILLLDEPTTYLDMKYQIDILNLVKKINEDFGITVIMVLHDVMQAINYSDIVVGIKDGNVLFNGIPWDTLNSEVVSTLYGAELIVDEYKGTKIVVPHCICK